MEMPPHRNDHSLKQLLTAAQRGSCCTRDANAVMRGPGTARTDINPYLGLVRPNGDAMPQLTRKLTNFELAYRRHQRKYNTQSRYHHVTPHNQFNEFNKKLRDEEHEKAKREAMLAAVYSSMKEEAKKHPIKKRVITPSSQQTEPKSNERKRFVVFEPPENISSLSDSDSYSSSDDSDSDYEPEADSHRP